MMDFDTFLDATRAALFPGTLPALNLPIKSIFHQGSCVFLDLILVSNYHSYKKKTIKLLPYHSFYGDHIPHQEKLSSLFWQSASKNTKPPGCPYAFSSIPLINFKLHLSRSLQHSTLNMCGYYSFFAEYTLVK